MLFEVKSIETRDNNNKKFLLKLHEILETKDYARIIHWSNDGKSFIIENLSLFTEIILPNFFKHNKFSSFVRQLNNYDFHKVKNSEFEYFHKDFSKFDKETINLISRKSKAKAIDKVDHLSLDSILCLDYSKISRKNTEKIIRFLIDNIEKLNRIIKNLELKIESLNKMKEDLTWQNQYIMQEMVKKNDTKRIETLLYFLMEFIFPYQKNMSDFFRNFTFSNSKNNILPSPDTEFNLKNNKLDEYPLKLTEKSHPYLSEFQSQSRVMEYNYPMLLQSEDLNEKIGNNIDNCSISYKLEDSKKEEIKHFSNEYNYNLSDFDKQLMNLSKSPIFEYPLSFNESDKNTNSPRLKFSGRKLKRKDSIFSSNSQVNGKTFSDNLFSINQDD